MLHPRARWITAEPDDKLAGELASELNISPIAARLLVARGMTNADEAARFLYAKEDQLHDPFLLAGMDAAVNRLRLALERKEKIRIYGDYDADGVCSTSLMIGLMQTLGASFDYYIPHRQTEGYGLNVAALDAAREDGVRLIVTVDTGISAAEEIAYAAGIGIDVVVTDHHEPPEALPPAVALINPKLPHCNYPYKSLAGVGVAFKLAQAILGRLPADWLEYVAIGTIADLMPLTGENRILVKMGLERLRHSDHIGIRALFEEAGIDIRTASSGQIGFSIAPRINASGRLERADAAVACLTSTQPDEARSLAQELDRLNRERQQLVERTAEEALSAVRAMERAGQLGKVLVLAGEGWNPGIVGIVASRVLEHYYRPTIVLGIDAESGTAKGSARSVPGFDMYEALSACASLLDHYGGHQAAAGMTLAASRIDSLRDCLNEWAHSRLRDEDLIPVLQSDMALPLEEVTVSLIDELAMLGPFGISNPHPRFIFDGLRIQDTRLLGKDRQHLKLVVQPANDDEPSIEALAFGRADWSARMSPTGRLDLYGELSVNEWNGKRRPQIMIKDVRILEKQLFDWRGKSLPDPDLLGWMQRKAEERDAATRGVVIFREDEQRLGGIELAELPVPLWTADKSGTLKPLNASASAATDDQIVDLMLLTLPPDEQAAEQALRSFASVERVYAVMQDTRPFLSGSMPSREHFKQVYALLRTLKTAVPLSDLTRHLRDRTRLTLDAVRFIVAVFGQLGFVRIDENERVTIVQAPPKRELSEAPIYQEKLSREQVEQTFVFSTAEQLKRWVLERTGSAAETEASARAQSG